MNSDSEYMHSYYSKIVYLHIYTLTDMDHFWTKIYIFYH